MVKYSWSQELTCAEILDDLAEAGINVTEWLALNVVDPADFQVYQAIAYVEGDDMMPDGFTVEKATKEFLELLHVEIRLGV